MAHQLFSSDDFPGALIQVRQQPELLVRQSRLRLDAMHVHTPSLEIYAQGARRLLRRRRDNLDRHDRRGDRRASGGSEGSARHGVAPAIQ